MENGKYYCKACGKEIDMDRIHICDNSQQSTVNATDLIPENVCLYLCDQDGNELVRFERDGSVYIQKVYTTNRMDIVEGFALFLKSHGYL